jgi:hypothetical protein
MKELLEALEDLATNADEDCPHEYRSKHFDMALDTAWDLIVKYNKELK